MPPFIATVSQRPVPSMDQERLLQRIERFDIRRIAIIKPSAFGDIVQTLPLLPVLRERFSRADISWVINRRLSPLVADHPDLADWIGYERKGGWRQWQALLKQLSQRRFDLVLDLQGLLRSGLMTRATRAPIRIGLETAREGSHFACHGLLEDSGRFVPAHRRYWRVAQFLGLGNRRPEVTIPILPKDRDWADQILGKLGGHVVAIHAGARWETKRWPVEHFAAVAAHVVGQHRAALVLVGAGEEEPATAMLKDRILGLSPKARVLNLAGQTTLKQLAALLSSVSTLVTNDSGPMHLAAGLETPVVGLFTCTDPARSGPAPGRHALVQTQVDCAGSYHKRCPKRRLQHLACFSDLSPALACEGLDRLLSATGNPIKVGLSHVA